MDWINFDPRNLSFPECIQNSGEHQMDWINFYPRNLSYPECIRNSVRTSIGLDKSFILEI